MQTHLVAGVLGEQQTQRAEEILRKCVHCGFCNATCPTYQVTGDEQDGPRGRIYLIKAMLEGAEPTQETQRHLDLCLTCHGCETTCPSGVEYGELIDMGREITSRQVPRTALDNAKRKALRTVLHPQLFPLLLKVGRVFKPMLPAALADKLGRTSSPATRPPAAPLDQRSHVADSLDVANAVPRATGGARKTWLLAGCVQPALMPTINQATQRVMERVGIATDAAPKAGCCGALAFHMDDHARALAQMRANIDAWWPELASGQRESVVMNASGCAAMVKSYGHYLAQDPNYADKAAEVARRVKDVGEVLAPEVDQLRAQLRDDPSPYAFHPPCTLQHWQPLGTSTQQLLTQLGFDLKAFPDRHMCCGSAGAYAMLQPEMSKTLRDKKLGAIAPSGAKAILSANVGCISHLQGGTRMPVLHWIEALDARLR